MLDGSGSMICRRGATVGESVCTFRAGDCEHGLVFSRRGAPSRLVLSELSGFPTIAKGKTPAPAATLSCHDDQERKHANRGTGTKRAVNLGRLQLQALADNLANVMRTLAIPRAIETWSPTSLRERLIKTGARLVRHGRYAVFQLAEAAVPRAVFAGIITLINRLRGPPRLAVAT